MRVHTRRITDAINSDQNEAQITNHDYRNNSSNNQSKSRQLESSIIGTGSSDKNLLEEPDNNNNSNMKTNPINRNNDNGLPVNNNVDYMYKK